MLQVERGDLKIQTLLDDIFKDCEIKGGRGAKNSPIALFYPRATKDSFFPDGRYVASICESFGISPNDVYATPVIKDYEPRRPLRDYLDLLVAEMGVVNPNVAWVLGRDTLELITAGKPKYFYRYIFGMYIPVLIHGFYGLLMPDPRQASRMPENDKKNLYNRVLDVVRDLSSYKGKEGPQEVAKHLRGDHMLIYGITQKEGYVYDQSLKTEKSFFYFWSKEIRDLVFVCATDEAKKNWLALGLGIVFTAEEIKELKKEEANFLAWSMATLGARAIINAKAEV